MTTERAELYRLARRFVSVYVAHAEEIEDAAIRAKIEKAVRRFIAHPPKSSTSYYDAIERWGHLYNVHFLKDAPYGLEVLVTVYAPAATREAHAES